MTEPCKHCGSCGECERCNCCNHCKKCGKFMPLAIGYYLNPPWVSYPSTVPYPVWYNGHYTTSIGLYDSLVTYTDVSGGYGGVVGTHQPVKDS